MEGKTTASSQDSRKINKKEVEVVSENPETLKAKFLKAGIGDFSIIAAFWSTTLQNVKTFVSETEGRISNFLEFDNGKVIPSEAFRLHMNSAILKLHTKREREKDSQKSRDDKDASNKEIDDK